jgi:hypothetical protein
MITYIKDISVCILVSVILIFISDTLHSTFFDLVLSSLLEVIFAVFAINIASTALIAELLNKVSEKTGKPLDKSKAVLMSELKIQALMIFASIILLITYNSNIPSDSIIYSWSEKVKYVSKIGLLTILLYFVWLTHDLGKSLFEILKAKFPN